MNYLINTTETYRVPTVEEVEKLHAILKEDKRFKLVSFSYKTKYIKEKREIVDEYQLVKIVKEFNEEKEPYLHVDIDYNII